MTVADAINRLQTNLTNSYSACEEKGATLPDKKNFDNLPSTISSIETGGGSDFVYGVDINDIIPNTSPATTPSNHDAIIPAGAEEKGSFSGFFINSGIRSITINANAGTAYQFQGICKNTPFLETFTYTPETIGNTYAFSDACLNSSVKVVNFSNITSSNDYTFLNAFSGSEIETFNAENLTIVSTNGFKGAFTDASSFKNFNVDNIKTIETYGFASAFSGDCGIEEVNFTGVTISQRGFSSTFSGNKNTKRFNATVSNMSNTYTFENCFKESAFDEVSIAGTSLLTVGNYAFSNAFSNSSVKKISIKNIGTIGTYAMQYLCDGVKTIEELNLDDLVSVKQYSMRYAFQDCDLSNANLNNLFGKLSTIATVSSGQVDRSPLYRAFYNANLGNNIITFSGLPETINQQTFLSSTFERATLRGISFNTIKYSNTSGSYYNPFHYLCRNGDVGFVRFEVLEQIGSSTSTTYCYGFMSSSITSNADVILPELKSIYSWSSNAQFDCGANAKALYVPKLSLIGGSTPNYAFGKGQTSTNYGFEEVHFGIENQSAIESLDGYDRKFGLAVRTTIYFDLVNHITVDGIVYDRQGVNNDCRNGYYSWNNGTSVIYTTNEWTPAIGDSVYTKSGGTYTVSGTITAVA